MKNYQIIDGQKSIPLNALPEEAWRVVAGDSDESIITDRTRRYYSTIGVLNRCISIRANSFAAIPWTISRGSTKLYTVGEGILPPELLWMRSMRRILNLVEASLLLYSRSYALIEGFLPPPVSLEQRFWEHQQKPEALTQAAHEAPGQNDKGALAKTGDAKKPPILQPTNGHEMQNLVRGLLGPEAASPKIRWLQSSSIQPIWDIEVGITGFRRTLSRDDQRLLDLNRVCFFEIPNPLSETAAAPSPVATALANADILFALDKFAQKFIERGAIKATLLRIDQTTPPKEREKIKNWWKDFMGGIKNAWTSEVMSTAVEPVVVGDGFREVVDPEITRAKAEEIATTLGIPHSLVFSDSANHATALTDERNLYTHALVPDAELVEEELNAKLFEPLGLLFTFNPESLRVYQENEKERADTFKVYIDSGLPVQIAVQIAGVELPSGLTPENLQAAVEEQKQKNMLLAQQEQLPMGEAGTPKGAETLAKRNSDKADEGDKDDDGEDKGKKTAPPQSNSSSPAAKSALTNFDSLNEPKTFDEIARFQRWVKNRITRNDADWKLDDFVSPILSTSQKAFIFAREIKSDENEAVLSEEDDESHFEHGILEISEVLKAMILQLDPDDDEAEQKKMDSIEAKNTTKIADALAAQKNAVFEGNEKNMDGGVGDVNMGALMTADNRIENISGLKGSARDALRAALIEGADLGIKVAVKQFSNVGFGFDWTLANEKARDWAENHSADLITKIDSTTKAAVRRQIAAWVQNGEPLKVLEKELSPVFGRQRASLIASTEVTRSYAEANRISYRESGIVKKIKWRTAIVERICPICGPLHNETAEIDEGFSGVVRGGVPPAHPRCRCWIVPVIEKKTLLESMKVPSVATESQGE